MAASCARFILCLTLVLFQCRLAVSKSALKTRNSTDIAPIVFRPDENWDGIDGSWSSFTLRVGTPAQILRVFPSWMSYQTWVVHPYGCAADSDHSSCVSARGGIFNSNASTSWDNVGLWALQIEENLGYDGNAYYGFDVVGLGGVGEGGPTLQNTTVGSFAVTDFYLGLFGLNPKPTNWTSFEDSSPSYMTQLKEANLIPSVSFGYTAGAPYRLTGVLGSLTLGGYDSSRFVPNDVEFTFAADNTRDLVLAIQSITSSPKDSSDDVPQLLPEPIYTLVDNTVAQIWLPIDACQAFEREFGLVYDDTTELYLVNSSLHDSLFARNANITFTLAVATTNSPSVNITLPYAAFDLTAKPPYQGLGNDTTYFPLRRAQNETQYTLGRTFMQEAYLTVDYERAKFNVSQCSWVQNAQSTVVTIPHADAGDAVNYSGNTITSTQSKTGLSMAAIIGIVVAGVIALVIAAVTLWFVSRRRRRRDNVATRQSSTLKSAARSSSAGSETWVLGGEKNTKVFPKAELDGSSAFLPRSPTTPTTLHSTYSSTHPFPSPSPYETWTSEADGFQLHEMPGSFPDLPQADGREMTEKDMIKHREDKYNGVDRHNKLEEPKRSGSAGRLTVPAEERTARRLVKPDQVRELSEEEGGNKRFSFQPESMI